MSDLLQPDVRERAADIPIDDAQLAEVAGLPGAPRQYVGRKLGWVFWAAVAFILAIVFSAFLAEFLPINDYDRAFAGRSRAGPNWSYIFGNDNIGQDVFARTIYGARISLLVAGLATLIGMLVGGSIGLITGYYRGAVDNVMTAGVDLILAFPALILALSMILFFDPEAKERMFWLIVVLGTLSIPPIARIVRSAVITYSGREFVQAARLMGARDGRIMLREVFPNVVPALLSYSLIFMAILVVVESGIGFLGLSVPPPQPTWGDMISKGRNELEGAAHISLFPAMVLFLTVLSLNYIGDKMREMFDVRESFL